MASATYLPEARDDIDKAYADYEHKLVGLGERFLEAVRRAADKIEANPLLYGECSPGIRACPTRRFPFIAYYRESAGQVLIIAVRHGRDDPLIWQGRA